MNYTRCVLRVRLVVAGIFSILAVNACGARGDGVAERCLLIDLQREAGVELLPYLQTFAKANGLDAAEASVIFDFVLRQNDKRVADIIYRVGMAEFGAQLAFFRIDKETAVELLTEFDKFVETEINTRYSVRRCEDVPDYGIPAISY